MTNLTIDDTGGTPDPENPAISMNYDGLLRDRVGAGNVALAADTQADGVFMVVLEAGSGDKMVTSLEVTRSGGGSWDTDQGTNKWVAGAAYSLDEPLLNGADASVDFELLEGDSFKIFIADVTPSLFSAGQTIHLNIGFSDGSAANTNVTLEEPEP